MAYIWGAPRGPVALSRMAYAIDPTGQARKARTLTATDPATGQTVTRRTDRVYVAAVVYTSSNGKVYAAAWAGRPDLAAKALEKRGVGSENGYRLAPVTSDPWATPEPEPTPEPVAAEPQPVAAAPEPCRPLLPGEPPAAAPVAPAGPEPTLPPLDRVAPTGDPLEGLPWDPGTPEARARHAEQGRLAALLHPIARAATGAGHSLPPIWWPDGPILNGEVAPMRALKALPLPVLFAAAVTLAALPPVTTAQAEALAYCRAALRGATAAV